MGRLGFEPRTSRLKAEYSAVELATQWKRRLFCALTTIAQPFKSARGLRIFFLDRGRWRFRGPG